MPIGGEIPFKNLKVRESATIEGSTPVIILKDSDTAAEDDNYTLGISATDEGDGTEDIDITEQIQIAGTPTTIRHIDADGDYEIGTASMGVKTLQNLNVVGEHSVGTSPNQLIIDSGGILSMTGTAKRVLTLRADMDFTAQIAAAKPTQVSIGVFKGYSFPIYAADNEELFFRETVPPEWDGASDFIFHVRVALAGAEDVADNFKFQFSWEHAASGEIIPATSHDVEVEQAVLTDRNAQHDEYDLTFTIDHDIDGVGNEVKAYELLGARLRRIDATDPDVTNEIIVLDWHTHYPCDKMYGNS